eukprot:c18250_g1_i2 orf=964-1305(+)
MLSLCTIFLDMRVIWLAPLESSKTMKSLYCLSCFDGEYHGWLSRQLNSEKVEKYAQQVLEKLITVCSNISLVLLDNFTLHQYFIKKVKLREESTCYCIEESGDSNLCKRCGEV